MLQNESFLKFSSSLISTRWCGDFASNFLVMCVCVFFLFCSGQNVGNRFPLKLVSSLLDKQNFGVCVKAQCATVHRPQFRKYFDHGPIKIGVPVTPSISMVR